MRWNREIDPIRLERSIHAMATRLLITHHPSYEKGGIVDDLEKIFMSSLKLDGSNYKPSMMVVTNDKNFDTLINLGFLHKKSGISSAPFYLRTHLRVQDTFFNLG